MTTYSPLRIISKDIDDLQIIAACLQDALVPLSGINYDPEGGNFHLVANRFCWECEAEILDGDAFYRRVQTGLTFCHVKEIKKKGLNLDNKTELVNLLTIQTQEENYVHLIFSGGAEIRLTVERLFCYLKDVDEPYHTSNKPSHESLERSVMSGHTQLA